MSDLGFETRFTGRIRDYAHSGIPPIDALAVAEAMIATGQTRTRLRWPVVVGRRWPVPVVLGLALALALAGAFVVGSRLLIDEPVTVPAVTVPVAAGRIAFVRDGFDQDGSTDIWVMDPDGSNRLRLTDLGGPEEDPAWSPDGRRIAYTVGDAARQISVMDADGSGKHQLTDGTEPAGGPTWSPDGRSIAYHSGGAIWVMRDDGTGVVRITQGPGDFGPAWSPSGDRIAFANGDAIYTVRPDGTGRALFARHAMPPGTYDPMPYLGLAWSPDGERIAASIGGSIWIEDGQSEYDLTDAGGALYTQRVTWSPDGHRLAFASYGGNLDDHGDIFVIDADGSGLIDILPGTSHDLSPAWSSR